MSDEPVPGPERMRAAVARYVADLHRYYLAQADTFPPAARGRMPLASSAGRVRVAAVGLRNLHLVATREDLGPPRGQEVEQTGSLPGLEWSLRFYDPVVVPALGLVDESGGARPAEVRGVLGVQTTVYHVVTSPGSGLSPHHAQHVGSGLAAGHSSAIRDFDTIRSRVRGREHLVDEMVGASVAGLVRAQALLARAISPHDDGVRALAESADPDPEKVRAALLAAVGGRRDWSPPEPVEPVEPAEPPGAPEASG